MSKRVRDPLDYRPELASMSRDEQVAWARRHLAEAAAQGPNAGLTAEQRTQRQVQEIMDRMKVGYRPGRRSKRNLGQMFADINDNMAAMIILMRDLD